MPADDRYQILFEPVRIGPKVAPNRFFQVPQCNGMGHLHPSAMARMREIKAEGGWGVVSTEECEIHPASEFSPDVEARLWDDRDIPCLARMAEAVHRHGSLAAIELAFNGYAAPNRTSRIPPMAPSNVPVRHLDPVQARAMSRRDIHDLRRWHRAAALRARRAGFDIVYVYAGHQLGLPMHFLSRRLNERTDEYGGSLENRTRLLRELIEDTRDAIGGDCAVAVRLAVDELLGEEGLDCDGEGAAVIELLAELPDLWDVNLSDWANDCPPSRFGTEAAQEPYIRFVKKLTTRPVVGVGWFTSPDTMVSQVRRGVLDLIGAARPSIADPFLPRKIREGRISELRECIACNVCVTGDSTHTPIRCTQNPTMGEEWRRGWHPERVPPAPAILGSSAESRVLVVGAGPAGLECARVLGQRGFEVLLAEGSEMLGGRIRHEAALPGLRAWGRVADYRVAELERMPNVTVYRDNRMDAADVAGLEVSRVVVATGSRWRADGVGRAHRRPITGIERVPALTPDDLMAGAQAVGTVLLYDDDHYYLGSVLAERLVELGCRVTLVTPASDAAAWTHNTLEHARIQRRLLELSVEIVSGRTVAELAPGVATLRCIYTGRSIERPFDVIVPVTSRIPDDELYRTLGDGESTLRDAGIVRVVAVGDCWAPSTIAAAVYSGHKLAREIELDEPPEPLRELPALSPEF
jgi:dimethylamine/trimethylamine dehydrogenase